MIDGDLLLGIAAIITAIDAPVLLLMAQRHTDRKRIDEIHVLANSNLTEARDAKGSRDQASAALIRSNEMLAEALKLIAQERAQPTHASMNPEGDME